MVTIESWKNLQFYTINKLEPLKFVKRKLDKLGALKRHWSWEVETGELKTLN